MSMISRQKLIEELKNTSLDVELWTSMKPHEIVSATIEAYLNHAIEIIEFQPSAESEIKRGKWIRYEDTHENSVKYICPFCGDYTAFRDEIAESTVNGNYIYCRHCGAKNGEDQ